MKMLFTPAKEDGKLVYASNAAKKDFIAVDVSSILVMYSKTHCEKPFWYSEVRAIMPPL